MEDSVHTTIFGTKKVSNRNTGRLQGKEKKDRSSKDGRLIHTR